MTDKLTWAEFVEKYQPKDGDKFLDDRGAEWVYDHNKGIHSAFVIHDRYSVSNLCWFWNYFACPLISPKKKRKMWPSIVRYSSSGIFAISGVLHSSEQCAKDFEGDDFHSWPAIPGPDGSYEVPE